MRALWDRLERAGVPSLRSHTHGRHMPHVSYAVLRTWNLAAVSAAVAGLGPVAPVELTFDGVGLFRRGRAWLLAGAAAEFVTRQERVVEAVIGTGAELPQALLSWQVVAALLGGPAGLVGATAGTCCRHL